MNERARYTWTRIRRKLACSEGAGAATMLIIIPVLVVMVELAVFGGRVAGAKGELQSAARQSAREASLAKGPGSADGAARSVAAASLRNTTFKCNSAGVDPQVGNFTPSGKVRVELSCTIDFSDLSSLSIPGSLTIRESAAEPIDPYRVIE